VTPEVCFLKDPEAVGLRAASIFKYRSKIAVASKGRFSVAVSGGLTPLRLHETLGSTFRKDISRDRTEIFWADERCVPPDHEDSNYKRVHDALLSRIDMIWASLKIPDTEKTIIRQAFLSSACRAVQDRLL